MYTPSKKMLSFFKLNHDEVTRPGGFGKWLRRKTALQISIAKWAFVIQALEKGEKVTFAGGTATCALCYLYHGPSFSSHIKCDQCPITQRAMAERGLSKPDREEGCFYTPWLGWMKVTQHAAQLRWAKRELEYLQSIYEELYE